ncbi:MAG: CDP-diacylglycerol--glycerol-3-phosphate 3-phosphatidyltransferase [Spirochaetaceae bacterium]|nr:CDP-diacylglycerol--glycerol-3-phosphate 3-phosphatidyltransferase [Spirochaetaceae bacterium]
MKISNLLSGVRIVLAPFFLVLFFLPRWYGADKFIITLILIPLFILLQITDYLDGKIARTTNTVTDFGKHFDPFCDALANLTILFCFMYDGFFPLLLYFIILYREFGITFLRMIASQHSFAIPAKMGGKVKTVLYICAAGFSLFIMLIESTALFSSQVCHYLRMVNLVLYCLAVLLSVITFVDYLREYRKKLHSQV